MYNTEFREKRPFYKSVDFVTYIAWLIEKNLIRQDADKLAITVLGREFLKWLVDNGRAKRGVG